MVGPGLAGLAAAASLRKQGVQAFVMDRGSAVGDSWVVRPAEGLLVQIRDAGAAARAINRELGRT